MRGLVVLLACFAALPAAAQERPRSSALEEMPAKDRDALVRRDLLSRLLPGSMMLDYGPQGAKVIVDGRAYATEYPGLCQRDELTVHYAPVPDSNARSASRLLDPRLEPVGFSADKEFRVIRAKVTLGGGPDPDFSRYQPLAGPCNDHEDPNERGWFMAEDAEVAAWGYTALALAADALRASAAVKLECPDEKPCRDWVIAEASPDKLTFVEKCDAPWGSNCYRVSTECAAECTRLTIRGTLAGGAMTVTGVEAVIEPDPAEII